MKISIIGAGNVGATAAQIIVDKALANERHAGTRLMPQNGRIHRNFSPAEKLKLFFRQNLLPYLFCFITELPALRHEEHGDTV